MTPTDLEALRDRVRNATGPDREIDAALALLAGWTREKMKGDRSPHWRKPGRTEYYMRDDLPSYTTSVDAVTALIEHMLPGWAWKIGTCSVSDDAWLVPDFNCPVHGERLRQEFGYPEKVPAGSIWDTGIDIDRRPPGNVPLALLDALLSAIIAQKVEG